MREIRAIDEDKLPAALELILAPTASQTAGDAHVSSFLRYLDESPASWRAWHAGPPEKPSGLFLALLLPGRTTIGMLPPSGIGEIDRESQLDVTRHGLSELRPLNLHYAEVLLDPAAESEIALLNELGFRRLTTLNYLERDVAFPWSDPPPDSISWVRYDKTSHPRFAEILASSYVDSLDCPELAGVRPIDDVIAAHQSSGRHTPDLWEIAVTDGQDAGCLILAPLVAGSAAELVYMGVSAASRRRGIGGIIMQRALQRCRQRRLRRLSTVVDDRNAPAKHLYDRFGMHEFARRDAYLFRWT